MTYLQRLSRRRAPQTAPIPGTNQIRNSAGGFAWAVDEWTRLRRFLILGSEGCSYYAGEWNLTRENAQAVERCLAADGPRAVAEIVEIRYERRRHVVEQCLPDLGRTEQLGRHRLAVADPNDTGQLDVVGFDTATPQLISDFARGAL